MEKKYQIFVSSTYTDLIDERRAVMEIILAMGHIPAGMELFSAGNQEQWDIIRERIDECDYYIVIVAGRYGSIAENNFSYTRKEYEYARKAGVPVAGFLLNQETAKTWPLDKCDPENNEFLEAFRSRVESLPVNYWRDVGDLKAQCAVALPKLIRRNPRPGWISGDEATDGKMTAEFARLSSENAELRKKVKELQSELTDLSPGADLERLANDLRSIKHTIVGRLDYGKVKQEFGCQSLYDIFLGIAPAMLIEIPDEDLRQRILWRAPVIMDKKESPSRFGSEMDTLLGDNIIGELTTYHLIEPSIKNRSLRDGHQYWKLTSIGIKLYKINTKMEQIDK